MIEMMTKYWVVKTMDYRPADTEQQHVKCESPEGCTRNAVLTIGTDFGNHSFCSWCYLRFRRGHLKLK